jgi:hypothetical protein
MTTATIVDTMIGAEDPPLSPAFNAGVGKSSGRGVEVLASPAAGCLPGIEVGIAGILVAVG